MKELFLTVFSVVLLSWILAGAPLTFVKIAPLSVDPDAPTFQRLEPGQSVPERDFGPQDTSTGDVESNFNRLKQDPCNNQYKKEFVRSLTPMLEVLSKTVRGDKEAKAKIPSFKDSFEIFEDAMTEGYVQKSDIPRKYRHIFPRGGKSTVIDACKE